MMLNENSYTWYVNQFKDHPAILMWEFGNEFNYHPEWFGNNIQNWYNILEDRASTVKALDPNHPVSTGHGEVPDSQALNSCPSVDVWGMNIYRWLSPESAIDELAAMTDKAMYISEAGADSFNINSNSENQAQQAQATEIILNAIIDKSDICIGVTLFEFCDEWWKAGNPNQQDPGGFSNAIPYDNFANEEYWGIVTRDRVPKLSYYVVQEIYEEDRDSFEESLANSNEEEPETEITTEPEPVAESVVSSNNAETSKVWHYTAGGITVISALLSYQAASSYNSLSDKNKQLADSYASTESSATKSEYESNQSTMKGYKSQVQTYDAISLVGLGWWTYLFFNDSSNSITNKSHDSDIQLIVNQNQFNVDLKWKF